MTPGAGFYLFSLTQSISSCGLTSGATTTGQFLNSSTYKTPVTGWITNPFTLVNSAPNLANVQSLGTTNAYKMALAAQWTANHQMVNTATLLSPGVKKIIYAAGGTDLVNIIPVDLGVSNYSDLQISLLENAAVSGNFQSGSATVPVYSLTGATWTGVVFFRFTFNAFGQFSIGVRATDPASANNYSMRELVFRVVQ